MAKNVDFSKELEQLENDLLNHAASAEHSFMKVCKSSLNMVAFQNDVSRLNKVFAALRKLPPYLSGGYVKRFEQILSIYSAEWNGIEYLPDTAYIKLQFMFEQNGQAKIIPLEDKNLLKKSVQNKGIELWACTDHNKFRKELWEARSKTFEADFIAESARQPHIDKEDKQKELLNNEKAFKRMGTLYHNIASMELKKDIAELFSKYGMEVPPAPKKK